jgi:CubicO group peptidase (beta-lactamase class C family)
MARGLATTGDISEKELDLRYQFTPEELIAAVNPDQGSTMPPTTGWSYSTTNYILAGLIIEKASGMSYKEALEKLILKPLNLTSTYYFTGATPQSIVQRMSAGFIRAAVAGTSAAPLAGGRCELREHYLIFHLRSAAQCGRDP